MSSIDINYVFFIGGALLATSIFASKLSSFIGTPILLLFLAIGMLSGEEGIFIKIAYNDYTSAFFIANLMLAVILLDGGMRTNVNTIKSVASESLLLASVGVLVTSLITGLAAYAVFDLSLVQAMLIGAIVGSTDAAAVFSLLSNGTFSLKEKISSTLQIESATNDPMAILLTTVLISILQGEATGILGILSIFILQFGLGTILGIIFGLFIRFILATIDIGSGLYALLAIGLGLVAFSITAALGGSGFLAIFIIGVMIGNLKTRSVSYILPVGEGITWLAQITLFLILGLLVTPSHMIDFLAPSVFVAVCLTFIARPIAVFACIKPFFKRYTNKEILFISLVGLRGSVPIVLAIYPVMSDIDNAQLYFNAAFIVVIFSLFVQGTSILPMAKLFKVYAPSSVAPMSKAKVGIMLSDDYEMYNYVIKNDALDGVKLRDLTFPSKTAIVAIFRAGRLLKARGDTSLLNDDIVSVIGQSEDEKLLNAVFNRKGANKIIDRYTGDIILDGELSMKEIRDVYKVELTSFEEHLSLSEFMNFQIGGFAQIGDHVTLINVEFYVTELSGDKVTKIGLKVLNEQHA